MSDRHHLAATIAEALDRRGWTVYGACQRMHGVGRATLSNLLGDLPARQTDGLDVRLRTAIEIVTVLWPDVKLGDFYSEQDHALLIRFALQKNPNGSYAVQNELRRRQG